VTGSADLNVAAMNVVGLHRTLDQELIAILRQASLECPVCGEFLLHRADGIGCPQCGLELQGDAIAAQQSTNAPAL